MNIPHVISLLLENPGKQFLDYSRVALLKEYYDLFGIMFMHWSTV